MSKRTKPTEPTGPLVYCGPTIKGIAKQYTTFSDGILPEALAEKAQAIPAIRALIVPLDALAQTRLSLGDKGSTESIIFSTIQKSL